MLTEVDMERIMEEKLRLVESVAKPIDYDLLDDFYLPEFFVVDTSTSELKQAD